MKLFNMIFKRKVSASDSVMQLLKASKANYVYKYHISGNWNDSVDGQYCVKTDTISIATYLSKERCNEVILHELAHWSGRNTRLSRISILNAQLKGALSLMHDDMPYFYCLEEIIAQTTMLKLARVLQLDNIAYYELNWESYLNSWERHARNMSGERFDVNEAAKYAEEESDKAVSFLKRFMVESVAEAA